MYIVRTTAVVFLLYIGICPRAMSDVVNDIPFGPLEYIDLPEVPSGMLLAQIDHRSSNNLIISYQSPFISIIPLDVTNRDHLTIPLSSPAVLISWIDDERGKDFLIVVPDGRPAIDVYFFNLKERTLVKTWTGEYSGAPYYITVQDITGDGTSDIIALFNDRTGIGVIRGSGDGTFAEPVFIFEDVLVSQFEILDFNGDGLLDVVLHDPIKNVLGLYYGFGNLFFSFERSIPFNSSVNRFTMLPLGSDGVTDLLVSFGEEKKLAVYLGDGFGRYTVVQQLPLRAPAHTIISEDLFKNGMTDLIIFEKEFGSVAIYRNIRDRGFVFAGSFYLGTGVADVVPVTDGKTGLIDLFIQDRRRSSIGILRSLPSVPGYRPTRLALAGPPVQLISGKKNFDSTGDNLYVLSSSASVISMFWYDNERRLRHRMIHIPGTPEYFYTYNLSHDRTKIIVLDSRSDLITVISVDWNTLAANIYGIPAAAKSEVVYLGRSTVNRFQFGTLASPGRGETASFSLYEQFGGDEYIERNITPVGEERLFALEAVDISRNSLVDLAYLYMQTSGSNISLAIALSDSQYVFRSVASPVIVGDSTVSRGFLVANGGKNNDSDITELVGYLEHSGSKGKLFRVTGTSSGQLTLIDESATEIRIRSMRDIRMLNVPGKAYHDILYLNAARGRIEYMPSDSTGTFLNPSNLLEDDSISSFAVIQFYDSKRHLVVGGKQEAVVTIYRNLFIY
jgi:hypothetical protein